MEKHNVSFVDIAISFKEYISGSLFIGETKNIAHTVFKIVVEYIDNSLNIVGTQLMSDEDDRDDLREIEHALKSKIFAKLAQLFFIK